MKRIFGFAMLVLGLGLTGIAPASSAGQGAPVFRDSYSFDNPTVPEDFLSFACGIPVEITESGMGTLNVYADGSSVEHFNTRIVLHSPETGETLIRTDAATRRSVAPDEVLDLPLLTINFDDTFVGLPAKWSKPGEGVLLRDAGYVNFSGTAVVNVITGELISLDEIQDIRGPHPELETDLLAFICGALGA